MVLRNLGKCWSTLQSNNVWVAETDIGEMDQKSQESGLARMDILYKARRNTCHRICPIGVPKKCAIQ